MDETFKDLESAVADPSKIITRVSVSLPRIGARNSSATGPFLLDEDYFKGLNHVMEKTNSNQVVVVFDRCDMFGGNSLRITMHRPDLYSGWRGRLKESLVRLGFIED